MVGASERILPLHRKHQPLGPAPEHPDSDFLGVASTRYDKLRWCGEGAEELPLDLFDPEIRRAHASFRCHDSLWRC